MPYRKAALVNHKVYHIFTKSIAGYKIFHSDRDFKRMNDVMVFYTVEKPPQKFSLAMRLREEAREKHYKRLTRINHIVKIIAYCFMPTHIHLILEQLKDGGISHFTNLILKSYTKYFNIKHNRKGPLWEGRFKSVLVETDEQLMHLTRYIHLNPTTSFLINNPEDWEFSSYREYLNLVKDSERICNFKKLIEINPSSYKEFVNNRIDYQRKLGRIKHLLME